MKEINIQAKILKDVRVIRSRYQRIKLDRLHYYFLFSFLKKHYLAFGALVFLFLAQGLIEALLIIFSRNQLSGQQKIWLAPFFWEFLLILLILFFINSYFSIRQEKTLGVFFANNLRRRIFKSYIGRPLTKINQGNQAELIAKISYQLPLASMGVSNSFFSSLRWLINISVITLLAVQSGLNWSLILLVIFSVSIIVAVSSYFISKSYISQEVTFYSQIIKEIGSATTGKYFLKMFNQEKAVLGRFDRLVDFDSIFRVRRDLWIKLCAKSLFAILLILSILSHFYSTRFFSWISLVGPETQVLYLFLLIYLSRSLYESLRVGLYFWPARLGLFLTIMKSGKILKREKKLTFKKSLCFYGRKIRLFKGAAYQRNFNWFFEKGGHYLFFSTLSKGKSALASTLAGIDTFEPKALRVKIDERRISYQSWMGFGSGICFFDHKFSTEKSLLEFILGQERETTDFLDIERALELINLYPVLAKFVSQDNNFNLAAEPILARHLSGFALYTLHCLVKKPELIIIDNDWLDLGYNEINSMLSLMGKELKEATIIVFSREDNNCLDYQKKYEIN
ncbi:MAG: hypothetical protein ACOYMB_03875 [Patescibacteria group bacterium]